MQLKYCLSQSKGDTRVLLECRRLEL